jgi:hypothetical protein
MWYKVLEAFQWVWIGISGSTKFRWYPDTYVGKWSSHEDDYSHLTVTELHGKSQTVFWSPTSRSSMGVDVADVNRWPDIEFACVARRRRRSEIVVRRMITQMLKWELKIRAGYHNQYISETCCNWTVGKHFTETALLMVLLRQIELSTLIWDMIKMVEHFVSNGISKRPNDLDYVKYYSKWSNKKVKLPPQSY